MDFLCASGHFLPDVILRRVVPMLRQAVRWLHSQRASSRPAVFLLKIAAALLSVLTLRDLILRGAPPSLETFFAVALWGVLLLIACCLAPRESNDVGKNNENTWPL
jgi:hypothetical protein